MRVLQEIDELVEDWTPEPLAAPVTAFEEAENEKRPVIVGCVDVGSDPLAETRVLTIYT